MEKNNIFFFCYYSGKDFIVFDMCVVDFINGRVQIFGMIIQVFDNVLRIMDMVSGLC